MVVLIISAVVIKDGAVAGYLTEQCSASFGFKSPPLPRIMSSSVNCVGLVLLCIVTDCCMSVSLCLRRRLYDCGRSRSSVRLSSVVKRPWWDACSITSDALGVSLLVSNERISFGIAKIHRASQAWRKCAAFCSRPVALITNGVCFVAPRMGRTFTPGASCYRHVS